MLSKQTSQENVAYGLAVLKYYLRVNSKANLQSANVSSEELISDLMNILTGKNFKSTSALGATYPGIDALDKRDRLGLQITHTPTLTKINSAIEAINKNGIRKDIDELYFFITSRKQQNYRSIAPCPGVSVSVTHIYDFDDLAALLNHDQAIVCRLEGTLAKALPTLYSAGRVRYQAMLDTLLQSRKELDRAVLSAPRALEEPEEMLKSLKEIRIAIQKGGVMNEAEPRAAEAFKAIVKIISAAEAEIAKTYAAGYRKYRAGVVPAWENSERSSCITLLMNIRNDVFAEIMRIDDEITALKNMLA